VVISIGMLTAGSDPAGYYLARRAGCPAEYYTGAGERAGVWLGRGAAAASLAGELDADGERVLRALLDGHAPDGRVLAAPVLRADPRGRLPARPLVEAIRAEADRRGLAVQDLLTEATDRAVFAALAAGVDRPRRRVVTVSPARAGRLAAAADLDPHAVYRTDNRTSSAQDNRLDNFDRYAAALAHAGRRVDVRRSGIDVTVSAPKSVSVLYALGNPEVVAAVRATHQVAVSEALGYLESAAGHVLRGHQGDGQRAARIGTAGWSVAAFEHHTSRAGDPQLHTHLVVPNLLKGVDGKWSAVDSKAIYRHALTASYLYHAVLRGELTAQLGIAWTTLAKGIAEIQGFPADLITTFSTRRRQILRALQTAGRSGPDAAQAACLASRPRKTAAEPEQTLREHWAARAREAGHHPGEVIQAVLDRTRGPASPPIDRLAEDLLGPTGLTAQATGFDRRDLLQALCQALPAGMAVDRAWVEDAADQVLGHRDAVRLATCTPEGPRWSTAGLLLVEQAALGTADELRASPARAVAADVVEAATAGQSLAGEQRHMVRALAAASGLAVVVGPAGSGKTVALAVAARAWAEQGRPVIGAAVAAVTARRLEHATGIGSTSLTRLLATARRTDPVTGQPIGLPPGGVLVVDEASMADTRTLAELLAHTRSGSGTLVLVGDPAQLPEIGAGGLFTALTRHPDTIQLTDNRRQGEVWERRALADMRAGDPDAAVAAYAAHGRVHTALTDRLADRVVDDYLRLLDDNRQNNAGGSIEGVVMLAVRRADVTDLNDTTRARLLAAGRLGPAAVTVGEGDRRREYRAGDRVLITANDNRLGLLNGTRAVITAVDAHISMMSMHTDDERHVTVPVAWAGTHLDHGYAMTCHKAQGATVEVALLYGTGALTREAGYVALSRGRTANHVYVPDDYDDRAVVVDDEGYLDRLAARLAVSQTQTLAIRQLRRAVTNRGMPSASRDPEKHRREGMSR
jgi:conjugative relaxase-like TrwC/TraI family protein